jgi:hypothetical protein
MKKNLFTLLVFCIAVVSVHAQSWLLGGNTGNPNKSFLGTKDLKPVVFRTNNMERMRITKDGYIGISTG